MWLLIVSLLACSPKVASLDPSPPTQTPRARNTVRLELADALLEARNTHEARQLLSLAAEEKADPWEIRLREARALWLEGLGDAAASEFQVLMVERPRDLRPLRWLALIEAESGRTTEAVAHLRTAVHHAPRDAALWNNLGFLLLSAGDTRGAIEALTRAVALDGDRPRYRTNLGYALAADLRDDAAWEAFREASSEAEAWSNLGFARELRADDPLASDAYRRALALAPDLTPALQGLDRLNTPENP